MISKVREYMHTSLPIQGVEVSDELKKELTLWIRQKIGPIATP